MFFFLNSYSLIDCFISLPDDVQNVPVIRAQGVINRQLKLAVHHLMVCTLLSGAYQLFCISSSLF